MSDKYPGGFVTANAPAGFSVYFDGSGDYLTAPNNTALEFGSGDFTVQCWVYLTSLSINVTPFSSQSTAGSAMQFGLAVLTTGAVSVVMNNAAVLNSSASDISLNTWTHIACSRLSGTLRIFKNGVQLTSVANSTTITAGDFKYIGYEIYNTRYLSGYISNLMVQKGTGYTSVPAPTQMFPTTNTSLLTCQSPTIIDNSTNNFTITANGDAKVSNFTPFAGYTGFNPALGAAAGGVWTLDEAAYYQNNRQWPIYDPYFNNTTLMLHGNGVNNAQNNTFLDSSTNNSTLTRVGNATQGTFTPFSQTGWSYYNNGSSGNNLTFPQSADFGFSGAFTIEAWINKPANNLGSGYDILASVGDGNAVNGWFFEISTNTAPRFYSPQGAVTAPDTSGVNDGRWHHWAVARDSSNTLTMYRDGVRIASATVSGTINYTGSALAIGSVGSSTTGGIWNGYISNFRIVKGTAVYTSNFTPSTAPLTAIPNTVLLTCQDNRYVDNSANNRTPTVNGTPYIQAFSPFVPTVTTPTTYSNYFDGTGDYLTAPSSSAYQFDSGNFTVEMWVNFSVVANAQFLSIPVVGALYFQYYAGGLDFGNNSTNLNGSWSPVANTWYHLAAVRNGSNLTTYVNGVVLATTGSAFNVTATGTLQIGYGGAGTFNGVFSNLRIVKGTAVYTTAFTPPTAPLTAISGTSLLTCQSSTFVDNSANNFTLTAYGNVRPVTSPTPFPAKVDTTTLNSAYSTSLIGGSYYGDGSGDYIYNNTTNLQVATTTNFTVECWLYRQSTFTSDQGTCFFAIGSETANRMQFTMYGSAIRIEVYAGALDFNGGYVPLNAWTHVAIVRTGGSTISIYINGVFATSAGWSGVAGNANGFIIGANRSVSNYVNGYIGGLRLINGTALYTSNFAPPTTPLTAISGTTLLTNFTNAAIYDNTAKNALETVGGVAISTGQSKYGGSSIYFDGAGDYLISDQPNAILKSKFGIGTGFNTSMTIEAWVYPTTVSSYLNIVSFYWYQNGSSEEGWVIRINNNANLTFYNPKSGGGSVTGGTMVANTWTHIAAVVNNNTMNLFMNGVSLGTATFGTPEYGNSRFVIGAAYGNGTYNNQFSGYIDDLRITAGVARYTTNFTPPTSQLQDQ